MSDRIKEEQVRALRTEVIARILRTVKPLAPPPSPQRPLGGVVHINGIGRVPIARLRAELERRHGVEVTGAGE